MQRLELRRVLAANPIITEFVASNSSGLVDGYDEDSDWIEIRNDADVPVDLQGYHLTDSPSDPNRWDFPSSQVLNPGEYLVVFASGRNTTDPSGNLHTNFQLSADGGYLALTDPDQTVLSEYGSGGADYPQQVANLSYGVSGSTFVNADSVSQYWVPTNNTLGTTWTGNSFDGLANGFSLGRAAIGYENSTGSGTSYAGLIETSVNSGTTNVYQRIEFDVDDASAINDLSLRLNYDDGVVVYLNGTSIVSENVPNPLSYNTPASADHPDTLALAGTVYNLDAQVGLLVDGQNTLAIHMLNRPNSSDFLLVPELTSQSVAGTASHLVSPTPGTGNSSPLELGPLITDVESSVSIADMSQPLVITASVNDFLSPLDASTVRLHYRIMYGSEVELVMNDMGTGGDIVAGDGVFTATIPASALNAGEMVRWYVTAENVTGVEAREPRFLDAVDSPEYDGTVVSDASITTDLHVIQWFTENPAGASTNAGSRASIFTNGEFYDNIDVNSHGQSTRGAAFPKKSFDFDANSGNKFKIDDSIDRVSDFNLLTNYADQTKLRHPLTYSLFDAADYAHHYGYATMVYRNGSFYGLFDVIEEGDTEYLERLGLDSDNPLYKVNNRLDHAYNNVEKKSREYEDHDDFQQIVDSVQNLSGTAAITFDFDNVDVANLANYLAVQNVTSSSDFGHKNMYWYRDTNGTGLWSVLPWDQDLSLGHRWDANVSPPYFRDDLVVNASVFGGFNGMFQRLYSDPTFREIYTRRVRTLSDLFYGTAGTDPENTLLGQRVIEREALLADEAIQDMNEWGIHPNFTRTPVEAAQQLVDEYIPLRRAYIDGVGAIPSSQVGTPSVLFDPVDYDADPVSGLQTEEYIRLNNPNNFAVDISGWRLDGGIDHRFKGGSVIPANGALYVVKDVKAFQARTVGPRGGQRLVIQGNYGGQLAFTGETVNLVADTGAVMDTLVTPLGAPTPNQQFLRVSEINYNPVVDDTEFLEFINISSGEFATTLDLSGVSITEGPSSPFVFPSGTMLAAGERILVVQDSVAMLDAYPTLTAAQIAGEYLGKLSNSGEAIKVVDTGAETIVDLNYSDRDPWTLSADGAGASLVLIDPVGTPMNQLAKHYRYRGSALPGGTPATQSNQLNGVVINEVLTHTDLPDLDAIELFNPTESDVLIGGWYLSDSKNDLLKYEIPAGTVLQAGGYVVFDESQFNPTPQTPGPNDFALSGSQGDEVWLVAANPTGDLVTEFIDQIEIGATFNGQSFGRLPNGTGRLAPLAQQSLGFENGAHKISDVVINEVHYHPLEPSVADLAIDPDLNSSDLEFIELYNKSNATVDLSHWRLRGDSDISFPVGTLIDAGAVLVVVQFDPADANRAAAFRNHFGIDETVDLAGALSGSLGNSFGRVSLQQPDAAPVDDPTVMPHVMVDEVLYDDLSPWPLPADGLGQSLQRVSEFAYAGIADSWYGSAATPGSLRFIPQVESVTINEGDLQRSIVDSLTVTFDREVNLSPAVFEIKNRDLDQVVGPINVLTSVVDGKTVAQITFGVGALTEARASGNTLADGNYQVLIRGSETTAANGGAVMNGNLTFGNEVEDEFFRLFGDSDGDRDVDGQDYGRFGLTFLQSSAEASFNSDFDSDGDGDVDGQDYGRFGLRFLSSLRF